MAVVNCVRCNRMFQKLGTVKICPQCVQAEEEAFQLVRDYLELNPGNDIQAVAEATGVDQSFILHLLQSGRLATLGDLAHGLSAPCRQCGKPTRAGKNCPECSELLGQALKTSAQILGQEKAESDAGRTRLRRPETLKDKHRGI